MRVTFWGVRGSIPCPGPDTAGYGGNTACIEVRLDHAGRNFIIDAGTGIRGLGNYMLDRQPRQVPIRTDIFLTHTHWDHIMGFPFFAPIYIEGTQLKIFGPETFENETLADVIGSQLTYRHFPVRQAELAAQIDYIDLKEGHYDLGDDLTLVTRYLNHPVLCLGYRFAYNGRVVCTVYDSEPFHNLFDADARTPDPDPVLTEQGAQAAGEENRHLEEFFQGADLLIYDAQYTQGEYDADKQGWGHTAIEYAIASARRNGVKRLALFHHDPSRTDAQLGDLARKYRLSNPADDISVFFAREGMEIELD